MTFKLLIYFMGLIAFVPSRDGKELTVLLVETRPGHVATDGSLIAPHHPMLLARAADCWGHCGILDPTLAGFFFTRDGTARANEFLSAALGKKGAAWRLDGSDLSIPDARPETSRKALTLQNGDTDPTTDFSAIADLGRFVPSAGIVDPDLLARQPPRKLIAARLRLQSGKVWTYRHIGPCVFKTLQGKGGGGENAAPSRMLADWVAAELEISDGTVEIVDTRFGGKEIRTIRLAPQDGLVELAVMNIPPPPVQQSDNSSHAAHAPAAHFERYYDLARNPPPPDQRPVPHAATDQGPALPSGQEKRPPSKLIDAIKLGDPKGFYERILCPPAQLSAGDGP